MTTPTLPTELLVKICSAVSSTSDLCHSLQASKHLAEIVRPFLYHHITIETQQQRERLKDGREEDKKLVKKLTIKGVGPITMDDMDERSQSYRGGEGCVEELFAGELLDISVIESLYITNLHFHLRETYETDTYLRAEKLVELSVSHQHGGARFWQQVLGRSSIFPSLQTLIILNLTCYAYCDRPQCWAPLNSQVNSSDVSQFREVGLPIQSGSDYQQLRVLVSEKAHSSLSTELDEQVWHLCLLPLGYSEYTIDYYVETSSHIRFLPDSALPQVDQSELARILLQPRNSPLVLLSFPFPRSTLSPELDSALDTLEKNGIEVHLDEEEDLDSTPLIPQHFVEYVKRMIRLKMAEEAEEVR